MGRGVDIPWVGGRCTMGRGRYTISKGVKMPLVGGSLYQG